MGIVGSNGAGKTTLIKLLTRLYDPTTGVILLDGVPITEIAIKEYYKHIGAVFQDFVKYELSLRENIGIGQPESLKNDDMILQAINDAGAMDLVSGMPEQFDTVLSRAYKKGVELSVGEWQKIAIARAFIRKNAEILILDEPTASLDVFTEQRIFERFAHLVEERTAILISHRFSTVINLDNIAVMKSGKIVEYGSHKTLVNLQGLYYEMFQTHVQNLDKL